VTASREDASGLGRGSTSGHRRSGGDYSGLNDRVATILAVTVCLSAVPLGSNRPFWWLAFGLLIGLLASYYLARGARIAPERRLQVTQFRSFLVLACLVPVFAIVQSLPIVDLLPPQLSALPASVPAQLGPSTLSLQPDASLLGALRAMIYLTFVCLVIEVSTRTKRTLRLAWILFIGVVLHAAWGLIALNLLGDIALWGPKRSYLGVATGTFVNRNSYATFLGFGLVLGIALVMQHAQSPSQGRRRFLSEGHLERVILGGMLFIVLFALLSTQSRLGTLATALGVVVTFTIMRAKGGAGVSRAVLEAVGVSIGLLAVGLAVVGSGVLERMVFLENEAASRLEIYRQVVGMIASRPWTGFGYDAFAPAFELFRSAPLLSEREVDLAHNSYLTLWSEMGVIIGSVPLLLLVISAVMVFRKVLRASDNPAIPAAAMGALVLGATHSMGDFSLEIPANVLLFLALIGMAIAKGPASERAKRNGQI